MMGGTFFFFFFLAINSGVGINVVFCIVPFLEFTLSFQTLFSIYQRLPFSIQGLRPLGSIVLIIDRRIDHVNVLPSFCSDRRWPPSRRYNELRI